MAGAYAVSSFGSQLNMVALNLFAYQWTGSPIGLGAVMVLRLAAGSLSGPLAPRLIARFSYKNVLLWTNAAQAAAMTLLASTPSTALWPVLVAVAVIGGSANTIFLVALRSVVPDLVGQERRTWANSLLVTGRSLAMVAGFASASIVVSFAGYKTAFLLDALTFALCLLAVASLRFPDRDSKPVRPQARPTASANSGRLLSGILLSMIALRGVDAFGSASHNVALPVYSTSLDGSHPAVFVSAFLTSWAIGNIAIQQVIRRLDRRGAGIAGLNAFATGTVLMSSAFILGFAGLPALPTMAIAFVAGCADGFTEVSYTSHLQALPSQVRDRAFGFSASLEYLGFGIGMALSAVLLEAFTPFSVVAMSHGVAILFVVLQVTVIAVRSRKVRLASDSGDADGNVAPAHRNHRDRSTFPGS
ncbi:hypothetical protein GCM10022223_32810 [Kineosporia mesophila]|uniref:Major facilitator superfamily (MFS) profile domain-containing protein n=1 Tax=Kineosporia mesophila TaxID=566012 RepID=A0ABP6ZQY1_9ACTN